MDPAVLGGRVRALRQKRKWTQKTLAQLAQVAPNTIRGLETGSMETRRPQYLRIVDALGTTPAMLERLDEPISADDPRIVGLPDEALEIAQAYTRASTPTRLRIERLLLTHQNDSGLALLDRFERLTAHRQETILQSLTMQEQAQFADDQKKQRNNR
jgi:transcriptional regulator with XRE-family HTH domain